MAHEPFSPGASPGYDPHRRDGEYSSFSQVNCTYPIGRESRKFQLTS